MKTMLNIKTEKKIKDEAQKVAKTLGLPLSAIVNRYLRDFIRDRRIEFAEPLTPNARTQKLLARIEKDIQVGRNLSGPFFTSEDIDAQMGV